MNNIATSNKILRVVIHLHDNTTKEISENICNGSGENVDMKFLAQELLSMQTKVNNFLTELVEQERGTTQANVGATVEQDEDDDDDDEDDEDEDGIPEPPTKQQKR